MCSCWLLSTSQLILLSSHGNTSEEQEHPAISKRLSNLLARFHYAAALLCFRFISFTNCSKSLIFFSIDNVDIKGNRGSTDCQGWQYGTVRSEFAYYVPLTLNRTVPAYRTSVQFLKRTVPTYRTRTIPKKAYLTSVPYL